MSDALLSLSVVVARETAADAPQVERLVERAFGPGRFARTAYRLRETTLPDPALCVVARVSTLLVGSNRMTAVSCGGAPALLLGPVTVDPAFRDRGIAGLLVSTTIEAARAAGHALVILVGDEPYYGRFGFKRVPPGRLSLPGPVDAARLLYLELASGAFEGVSGAVTAARGS